MLRLPKQWAPPQIIEDFKSKMTLNMNIRNWLFDRLVPFCILKKLLVKRASDILSPYVGEAEMNIAKIFEQAKRDNAVLLLDEADSFLMDRKRANHSWEVTQVNELLTQMEVFEGIFVCSTNLMDNLDEASIRRFDLKIKIDYSQIEKLAQKHHPKIIVAGTTSYPRKINFSRIARIAHKIGAYCMADISHIAGLVLAELHPSPFISCDIVTTTIHKTLRGPRAAVIFINKKSSIARKKKIDLPSVINKSVFPQMQGGPHNNVTAAIALTFHLAQKKSFLRYQQQIVRNSRALADELRKRGFRLVSGGTDNHLLVIDLRPQGVSGLEAEKLLERAGIIANRNVVPQDKKPWNPSGIRIGTPAVTSRGMKEREMKKIAQFLFRLLVLKEEPSKISKEVKKFTARFPLQYYN